MTDARKHITHLLTRYRVTDGDGFRLKHIDTDDSGGDELHRDKGEAMLRDGVARLSALQEKLYAQGTHSMLCVFQAMDAAGKDGTIKHVMSGVNPQGVQVTSFKAPGPAELAHDFLWRIHQHTPARGNIGIFNRSQYEDVLVTRVHPALVTDRTPDADVDEKFWRRRLKDIVAFERHLARDGALILKFYLHISKAEQRRRFLERLEDPAKHWKFSDNDLTEREYWDDYTSAYEAAIAATAKPFAPWFVVPADHKWFAHLIVVEAMIAALEALDPQVPETTPARAVAIAQALQHLRDE